MRLDYLSPCGNVTERKEILVDESCEISDCPDFKLKVTAPKYVLKGNSVNLQFDIQTDNEIDLNELVIESTSNNTGDPTHFVQTSTSFFPSLVDFTMPDEIQSFFIEGYYETDIQRTIDHTFSVYTTDGCLLSTDDVFFPIDVRLPPTPPTPDVWSWFNSFNCDDDVIANEEVTLGLLLPDLQDVSGFDFEFSYDNTDVNPLSGNPFVSDWFDITYTIDDNAGIISGTAIRKDPLSKLDIGIFSGSDADVVIGNNVMQIKFVVNPGFQINSCTFAGVSNIDLSVLNSGATEIFTRTTGFGDHICLSGNSCSCTGTTLPENIQTHFWQFMGNDVTYLVVP